jgi:alcohol dehydrogenase
MSLASFDFHPQTRIVYGPGKIAALGALAKECGATRALVVSDPGVIAAGHAAHGIEALKAAGLEAFLFQGVHENPSTVDVAAGVAFARQCRPDLLVGLGGGSSMDCCKGVNFILTNGGEMRDYWGVGKATQPMLPMIAVPTTAGTGSETQSFALISDAQTHAKMACGDKKASCKIAVLDPELTVTMPQKVTALTGIDAISHALETYVTNKRNAASLAFSREAWQLLAGNFGKVLDDGANLEARGAMLLGASFAGLAIENSMLGIAHSLANPLSAHFGVAHGQAVAVMLPHVIRFNAHTVGAWYCELLESTGGHGVFPHPRHGCEGLCEFVSYLIGQAGLAMTLRELQATEDRLPTLAADASRQWTAQFNPRSASEGELLSLYRSAF